ncbi:hypothetical protein BWK69_00640 [Candidatus Parcubacteria bacterium A4]|nr:MAG: hypothetical protein BWK69_00640 [Candidatus Parcubacteria bacterium A4]
MRIAVFSDSHDNMPNLKKALQWIEKEKIKIILHCGDICNSDTLREMADNFSGKIYLAFGNADDCSGINKLLKTKKLPNVFLCGEIGEIELVGRKIGFCHFPEIAKEMAESGKYNMVFHGHTHKPWESKINFCRLINPGNMAGLFYKASFAVYNTKTEKLELKILEILN